VVKPRLLSATLSSLTASITLLNPGFWYFASSADLLASRIFVDIAASR
jgi:hypothetical protein